MKEVIRVRCPLCGSLPELERVQAHPGPWPQEVYTQRFGGKAKTTEKQKAAAAGKKKGKGSNPGYMEYELLPKPAADKVTSSLWPKRIAGLGKQ